MATTVTDTGGSVRSIFLAATSVCGGVFFTALSLYALPNLTGVLGFAVYRVLLLAVLASSFLMARLVLDCF